MGRKRRPINFTPFMRAPKLDDQNRGKMFWQNAKRIAGYVTAGFGTVCALTGIYKFSGQKLVPLIMKSAFVRECGITFLSLKIRYDLYRNPYSARVQPMTYALSDTVPVTEHSTVRDYFTLLKPRVMTLVVFSGIAGMVAAPGAMHPLIAITAIVLLAVGAGASGAYNMWYDRDIDAIMNRTKNRPLPLGRITPDNARDFAVVLMFLSTFLMGIIVNWAAAGLLAFAQWFYAYFYTVFLKRRTAQNIVIGGAAGAFPPMIGWAAVTGNVTIEPILYFLIIFLWTPPHFWALALVSNEDYARAGIPMLPVTKGAAHTRLQMLVYTLILWPVSVLPSVFGDAGNMYGIGAFVLGALFTISAVQVMRLKTEKASRLMFAYSILYLFLIFALVMIDRWM